MRKQELVDYVMGTMQVSEARAVGMVDVVLDGIRYGLRTDGKVKLMEFGIFTVRERKARQGRDPRNGASITIEAAKRVKFLASKTLHVVVS